MSWFTYFCVIETIIQIYSCHCNENFLKRNTRRSGSVCVCVRASGSLSFIFSSCLCSDFPFLLLLLRKIEKLLHSNITFYFHVRLFGFLFFALSSFPVVFYNSMDPEQCAISMQMNCNWIEVLGIPTKAKFTFMFAIHSLSSFQLWR